MKNLESSTLPDDGPGSISDDWADDIEVALPDELSGSPVAARVGQNEVVDDDDSASADAAPSRSSESNHDTATLANERRLRDAAHRRAIETETGYQKALLDSELRNIGIQRASAETKIDAIDMRIHTARQALKGAKMDGDVGQEVEFQAKIDELVRARHEYDQLLKNIPSEHQVVANFEKWRSERLQQLRQEAPASPIIGPNPGNPIAAQWAAQNAWISDPAHEAQQRFLIQVNNNLDAEGYDPKSNEFYAEMARRMSRKFPSLAIKDQSGRTIFGTARNGTQRNADSGGPPVASARITQSRNSQGKMVDRVRIGGDEQRMLKAFGADLSDQKKVGGMTFAQRFAFEKAKRLREEQRSRGR